MVTNYTLVSQWHLQPGGCCGSCGSLLMSGGLRQTDFLPPGHAGADSTAFNAPVHSDITVLTEIGMLMPGRLGPGQIKTG